MEEKKEFSETKGTEKKKQIPWNKGRHTSPHWIDPTSERYREIQERRKTAKIYTGEEARKKWEEIKEKLKVKSKKGG